MSTPDSETSSTQPVDPSYADLYGDANCDGTVDDADYYAVLDWLDDPENNPLSEIGLANADVYNCGDGVTADDADIILAWLNEEIESLPYSYLETPTTTGEKETGDVNDDGVVNIKDVIFMRRYILSPDDSPIDTTNADMNDDGIINIKDVILIRRYILGDN